MKSKKSFSRQPIFSHCNSHYKIFVIPTRPRLFVQSVLRVFHQPQVQQRRRGEGAAGQQNDRGVAGPDVHFELAGWGTGASVFLKELLIACEPAGAG